MARVFVLLLMARPGLVAKSGVLPIVAMATAKARGGEALILLPVALFELCMAMAKASALPVPVVGAQSSALPGVIVGVVSNKVVPSTVDMAQAVARLVLLGGLGPKSV